MPKIGCKRERPEECIKRLPCCDESPPDPPPREGVILRRRNEEEATKPQRFSSVRTRSIPQRQINEFTRYLMDSRLVSVGSILLGDRKSKRPIGTKSGLYFSGEVAGAESTGNGRTTARRQPIHITLANPGSQVAFVQLRVYVLSGWQSR